MLIVICQADYFLRKRLIAAMTREHRRRRRVLAPGSSEKRSRVQCLVLTRLRGRERHLDEVIAAILAGAQASARTTLL